MRSVMNASDGIPPRLYRSVDEISRDITKIKSQIAKAEELLSTKYLLMEMLPTFAEKSPKRWIPELEETIKEVNEGLLELKELKMGLTELLYEIKEVQCILISQKTTLNVQNHI